MSTPTRPCPYCGAAVLMQAAHCGTCGRPMPPGPQPPPPAGNPRQPKAASKTVFGIGAAQLPPMQQPGGAPPAGAAPQPPAAAPAPGQPAPGQPPQPAAPSVAPPQGPPSGGFGSTVFGQPAPQMPPGPSAPAAGQPFGAGPASQAPVGGPPAPQAPAPQTPQPQPPPAAQPGFPPAAAQPPSPAAQPGFPPPAAAQPPSPAGQPGAAPAPGGGFAPTPAAPPADQAFMQQPPAPGEAPSYPVAGQPAPDADPLAGLAARLPQSDSGTLFGVPLATLRDQELERKVLQIAGIALAVAAFLPFNFSPLRMPWDVMSTFKGTIFPLLTAAVYLAVGFAPKEVIKNVPPVVLRWGPFAMAFLSIGIVGILPGPFSRGGMGAMSWGYAILVFGLLNRLNSPEDPWARYIIGAGGALAGIAGLTFAFDGFGSFRAGVIPGIYGLLLPLVVLLCLACVAFAFDPKKFPQLRSVDAFAPLVTAILLAWLPLQAVLIGLGVMGQSFMAGLLFMIHLLVSVGAYFGVLMLTAPEAYDEGRRVFAASQQAGGTYPQPPPGAFPPQGPPAQMPSQPMAQQPPPAGYDPNQGGGSPPAG